MLDVGKLATLRAVIAHGSFSAAGHAIGLTQPAVSRQVSLLERRPWSGAPSGAFNPPRRAGCSPSTPR